MPIYLINATLIGAVFGVFHMISGSVGVPSQCHAIRNSTDYPLFGFGERVGALGIRQALLYGPEVGVLGIGLNLALLACLLRKYGTQVSEKTR